MAHELNPIDISNTPDLLRLAEEVAESGKPRVLRRADEADVLPLNKPIMKRFARIRGHLRQTGSIIGQADVLIAATALHYNLTVVTRNIRHFERIPDLLLYQG